MILAGGKGTRISEYSEKIPKPMIPAVDKPILMHIVDIYRKYGKSNFVVLAGYKQEVICEYFQNNYKKISTTENRYKLDKKAEITVLDTGPESMTGWRVKKGIEYLDEEEIHLTYGDGLANININKLEEFHKEHKPLATVTAVRPPARFGYLELNDQNVTKFGEKDNSMEGWINGGFFIINKGIHSFLEDENEIFEKRPLEELSKKNKLNAYRHYGFWQHCDTIRELQILEKAIIDNKLET